MLYQDLSLTQDTNTHINDDYDLDIFNGELAPTHNSTEITDDSEDESMFELCIHTFINDVNNLFVFAQLDVENVVQIENSLVERDNTVLVKKLLCLQQLNVVLQLMTLHSQLDSTLLVTTNISWW